MRDVVETFLKGNSLRRIIKFFCDTSVNQVVDPVTETLCMMLTTPLQFSITEIGVTFFKDKNTHVFPYRNMTQGQLEYVRDTVNSIYGVDSVEESARMGVQMGGGCVVKLSSTSLQRHAVVAPPCPSLPKKAANVVGQNTHPDVLDAFEVLGAFCTSVFSSKLYGGDPQLCYNLCNVIIQRVCTSVHLQKDVQRQLFNWCSVLKETSSNRRPADAATVGQGSQLHSPVQPPAEPLPA